MNLGGGSAESAQDVCLLGFVHMYFSLFCRMQGRMSKIVELLERGSLFRFLMCQIFCSKFYNLFYGEALTEVRSIYI